MNRSQATSPASASYVQIALILGAMLAGAVLTQVLPEVHPMAAYLPPSHFIPTTEVFKHANAKEAAHDVSRDLTGIDVDVRRLAILGCIS